MEAYFVVIGCLVMLALTDLWVGVSNDAVNFLVGAVGSKAAKFKTILFVAAIGLLIGVTFSSGMMEVARKGIVHPEMFYFNEIIIIFIAYAIADVILLDLFNTFGMPTSTTVSMIFGLVGSGTVISIMKIVDAGGTFYDLENYINTAKVITFGSAIIISVVVSFIVGASVQYLSRLLFTFDFEKRFKRWGGIWSGFAITMISFFIMMKGLKGAAFITPEVIHYIENNIPFLIVCSFGFWTILTHLLLQFTKVNVLKGIVLLGTFSLAMAFAANDLVNFIGVSLAAIDAFSIASSAPDPLALKMSGLNAPYSANLFVVLSAGLIMVLVLWKSKKSKTVIKMTVGLGSQGDEVQRFQSNGASRALVRGVANMFDGIRAITPQPIKNYVNSRFDRNMAPVWNNPTEAPPSFDLVRAAVNLLVAAALISFGTSLKLPLSTTYVGFIVAMGSAFADRAWGRDSAAYRVSGVLTVIGGWFFTGFMASVTGGLVALIIWYTGFWGMGGLIVLAFYLMYKNSKYHKKREKEFEEIENNLLRDSMNKMELYANIRKNSSEYIYSIANLIESCADGIENSDLKSLKLTKKLSKDAPKKSDMITGYIAKSVKKFDEDEIKKAHLFTDLIGYFNVLSSLVRRMIIQSYDYFDNNHRKMTNAQIHEITVVSNLAKELLNVVGNALANKTYAEHSENIDSRFQAFKTQMNLFKAQQAARLMDGESSSFQNLLYLSQFDYYERLVLNSIKIITLIYKFLEDK